MFRDFSPVTPSDLGNGDEGQLGYGEAVARGTNGGQMGDMQCQGKMVCLFCSHLNLSW